MKTVYLLDNPLEPATCHEVAQITPFLLQRYGHKLPAGIKIYHQHIGVSHDVTPCGQSAKQIHRQLEKLRELPGPFHVVNHPGSGLEIGWFIAAVAVAAVGAAILLRPKIPNVSAKGQQVRNSPNNSLAGRTNEARVNGRIPEIVGTQRSTPDLIANTYSIYTDHVKREVSYMCIGRGTYQIHDMRDDTTPIAEIPGSTAEIYGPHTSPNSGHAPQLRVGDPIDRPLLITKLIDSVNGQTLIANDAGAIRYNQTWFEYPNRVVSTGGANFSDTFVPGDVIVIEQASQTDGTYTYQFPESEFYAQPLDTPSWGEIIVPGNISANWQVGTLATITNGTVQIRRDSGGDEGAIYDAYVNVNGQYPIEQVNYNAVDDLTTIRLDVRSNSSAWRAIRVSYDGYGTGEPIFTRPSDTVLFDLSGTYTVVTVSGTLITLANPESINPDWLVMENQYGGVSNVLQPILRTSGDRWIGWFTVQFPRVVDQVISNVIAPGGMFLIDGNGNQKTRSVTYRLEAERLDDDLLPTGDIRSWERTITGSATSRSQRSDSLIAELGGVKSKNWRFRIRRLSSSVSGRDEVVDEITWEEFYIGSYVGETDFGDVTTVYTLTTATERASSLKQRRFNALVTRMIPLRIGGDEFTPDLHPTNDAANIFSFLALDPHNGRRTKDQLDFDSIFGAYQDVVDYFGTPFAGEFCYTFDSDTLSYEDIATQIAQAVFCQVYRRGPKLRLYFERQTDHRSMLFNHRNVIPGSEEYSGSFGRANSKDHDGLRLDWSDPETDSVATITLPEDGSALNPLKIETIGVRNHIQAHFHAWREYQKILYQRTSKTFDALHMANLLIPKNVVLCADGTRPETIAGDVLGVEGLVLYLDREIDWQLGSDYYIFLQGSNISTDAVPIQPGPTADSVLLARAPSTPVVTDRAFSTNYSIRFSSNIETLKPYFVVEKNDRQNMVIGLQVVQYDDRIYLKDQDFKNGVIQ